MRQQPNTGVKHLAIGVGAALFLGLTVWLIRGEGRRTRESIREAAEEAGGEVRKGLVEGAERVVDKAAEAPGRVVRDVTKGIASEGGLAAKHVVGEAGRVSRELLGDVKDILRPMKRPEATTPTRANVENPSSPAPPATMEEKPPAGARGPEGKTPPRPASRTPDASKLLGASPKWSTMTGRQGYG